MPSGRKEAPFSHRDKRLVRQVLRLGSCSLQCYSENKCSSTTLRGKIYFQFGFKKSLNFFCNSCKGDPCPFLKSITPTPSLAPHGCDADRMQIDGSS